MWFWIFRKFKIVDSLKWDYSIHSGYILNPEYINYIEKEVLVTRVIDWDTIEVKFPNGDIKKIRLIWIDSPETKHPDKDIQNFWIKSTIFTRDKLLWKKVIIKQSKKNFIDKYNRLLWYIYLKGDKEPIFFNKLIIEEGLARAYLKFDFEYSEEFNKSMQKAKREKKWIWSNYIVSKEIKNIIKQEKNTPKEIVYEKKNKIDYWKFVHKPIETINWIINNLVDKKNNIWKKVIRNFNWEDNILSFWDIKEDKKIRFNNIKSIEKDSIKNKKIKFSKNIRKQKRSLRIDWKTIPNSSVLINIWDDTYLSKSDIYWKYSININNLKSWNHQVDFQVIDEKWNYFNINKKENLILEQEYISNINKYLNNKIQKEKIVKEKTVIKSDKKQKNIPKKVLPKKNTIGIKSDNNLSEKTDNNSNFKVLYFLLFGLVFIFWNIILIKRKII